MIENLKSQHINGTVFIIPFTIPQATMHSSRRFKGFDMNRKASSEGYITYKIIDTIKSLKINSLADFMPLNLIVIQELRVFFALRSRAFKVLK